MPRPKVHDDALRTRLLEQAVRTLSEEGPDALSLRRLAAQVGTSTTAVYSLFGGKPGLLSAVYDEAFVRFGQRMAQAEGSDDPAENLLALARAYRAGALAEPHFYQVMFGATGATDTPDPETLERAEAVFRPLLEAVRRAIESGLLRNENAITIAVSIWATVHGMISLELRSLLPPAAGDPAQVYEQAMRALGEGWHYRGAS